MHTRAEHLETVASALAHVPEIVELAANHHRLRDAAERVVAFTSNAYRPPGRLGDLIDALGEAVATVDAGPDPTTWDVIEWRRRCADAGVAQAVLLQRAVNIAANAGAPRPHSLNDIHPDIAGAVADDLETLRSAQ